MVVAVAIFAVMASMAYSGLNQTVRAGAQVGEANQRLSALQFSLTYFGRDWLQVVPRKILNQYGDVEDQVVIADNSIKFTRGGWSNLLAQKRSELQRVQYLLVEDRFVRRHWFALDQGIGVEPFEVVLLEGVKSMQLEFIDDQEQAIETWPDTTDRSKPPIALKITLDLEQFGAVWRILEVPDAALQ